MINSHLKFFGLGILGRLCVCGSTLAVFSTLGGLGRGSSCNRCVRGWCKRHWRMRTGSQRDRRMSWRPQRSWHMGTWRHSCNWGMRRRSHCGWRVSSRLICNNCSRSGWRMGRGAQGSWRMGTWPRSCNRGMRGRAYSGWSVSDNRSSWGVRCRPQRSRRMGTWRQSCHRCVRSGCYTWGRVGAGSHTCRREGNGSCCRGAVCCGRSCLGRWLIIKDVRQISHEWREGGSIKYISDKFVLTANL